MKKFTKFQLLSIITLFFLTSCNSRFSLSKRHYTKGYYFAHSNKKSNPKHKVNSGIHLQQMKENNPASIATIETNSLIPSVVNVVPVSEAPAIKTGKKMMETKLSDKKDDFPFIMTHKTPYAIGINKENSSNPEAGSGEGRSLFWIVVIVLVVLWALGLISGGLGLGILINLLLVIALVLLILWLLRIV